MRIDKRNTSADFLYNIVYYKKPSDGFTEQQWYFLQLFSV